jgi:hypothetical protein
MWSKLKAGTRRLCRQRLGLVRSWGVDRPYHQPARRQPPLIRSCDR